MTMNIFETATRSAFRYPSVIGMLTTEQVWELPLKARNGVDLDTVAKHVNAELKEQSEESFVEVRNNPRKTELEVMLEVVKHVIAVRVAEADARKASAERAEKRRKIIDAIAAKEDQELSQASKDDLLKQLAELDG